MPTNPAPTPAAVPIRQNALTILGAELFLVGVFAAVLPSRVAPRVVLGMCVVIAATSGALAAALARSVWRPTANATLALSLSFVAMPPGVFFFFDILTRTSDGFCYERPWCPASASWLLVGPALLVASAVVSPWRVSSMVLLIIQVLHGLVWLLGTGNTMMCAMTI
jgi:hypothetical protein